MTSDRSRSGSARRSRASAGGWRRSRSCPALFEEYEIRTVVVTDERLPLPEGVERLPLDRAREADAASPRRSRPAR